jgi:hypothetical protein
MRKHPKHDKGKRAAELQSSESLDSSGKSCISAECNSAARFHELSSWERGRKNPQIEMKK